VAALVLLGASGCGGRAESCDSLQDGCNPPARAPTAVESTPARSDEREGEPEAGPAPEVPTPGVGVGDPAPIDDIGGRLAAAASRAGCSPLGDGLRDKLQPAPRECGIASPYYPSGSAVCTDAWCAWVLPTISSCEPVPVRFAGGYNYFVESPGASAEFFFLPVGGLAAGVVPVRENFGWLRAELSLGATEGGEAVSLRLELPAEQAFAAGLDVVDGVIVGTLDLGSLSSGIQGPLYLPSCGFELDELGNEVPGGCACSVPAASLELSLYVPLGAL
jgi:hypothetical protein